MDHIHSVCPGCNSVRVTLKESLVNYNILVCNSCTLEFADPMKAMSSLEYESDAGYDKLRFLGENDRESVLWWGHKQFLHDAHRILPVGSNKLLDIGCGTGAFVHFALGKGWDAYGVDFDSSSINIAWLSEQLRKRVFLGDTFDIDSYVEGGGFDVVTFFEVLEHVENISLFMKRVRGLLRPDGHIALYVPLGDRWSLRYREREPADYPPNHLTRWTEKSLRMLMERTGFDVVRVYESPVSLGLYRIVHRATVTNASVTGSDVGKGSAAERGRSRRLVAFFEAAVKAKQVLLTPVLSTMGIRGDRMLLIAKKNGK